MTAKLHTPGRVSVLLTVAATAMAVAAPYIDELRAEAATAMGVAAPQLGEPRAGAAFFGATAIFAWAISVALSDRWWGLVLTAITTGIFVADIAVIESGGSVPWIRALTSIGVLVGFLSILCIAAPEIISAEINRGKQTSAGSGANTSS